MEKFMEASGETLILKQVQGDRDFVMLNSIQLLLGSHPSVMLNLFQHLYYSFANALPANCPQRRHLPPRGRRV